MKLGTLEKFRSPYGSLPLRERELKLRVGAEVEAAHESLPLRERELKLVRSVLLGARLGRSPCGSVN